MAQMTLLEMVQDILSDMNSDAVNSISDTTEADQVARIIESTFYELINARDWPHLATMGQLEASGTSARPTHMKLPVNVQKILWLKYNKRTSTDTRDRYSKVEHKEPQAFVELLNARDSSDTTNVSTITDLSSIPLYIIKTQAPSYYTSFDNEYLVFDSYDNTVDSTLQQSKTQVHMYREPVFTQADTFVPDLPDKAFSYFLAEAKSTCFNTLKQSPNAKEEQKSNRQRHRMSREKWRQNGGIRYPNYGRK